MAELAEQVDLRTLASALDFSTAHLVIWRNRRLGTYIYFSLLFLSLIGENQGKEFKNPWTFKETLFKGHGSFSTLSRNSFENNFILLMNYIISDDLQKKQADYFTS